MTLPDEAREAIRNAYIQHSPAASTGDSMACRCDRTWRTLNDHAVHVAEAAATAVAPFVVSRESLLNLAQKWDTATAAAPTTRHEQSASSTRPRCAPSPTRSRSDR